MPCRCGITFGNAANQCSYGVPKYREYCCCCYFDGEGKGGDYGRDKFAQNACDNCKKRREQWEGATTQAQFDATKERRVEAKRKREQEERERCALEEARLHDVDWRVQRAGEEAVKSFDSLRFLGATFVLVKAQRSSRSHLHETVEAFRRLVDTLKGQLKATHQATAHAANVAMAAREAKEGAEWQRRELAASQSKIQHHVALSVQGKGKAVIDCLQELPEGVQAEMRSRNLLRAQYSRELRLAQAKLLQAGTESATGLLEAGAHSTCMSDLGERVKAKLMAKEEQLKEAIEQACDGIVRYNITQVRGTTEGRCAMGESAVPTAAEGGQVVSALAGYDEWVASYLHDDHTRKSDAAMKELQKQLADNKTMSAVLGLQEERTGEQGGGLKTALRCAAAALEREREHQLSDPLACFPCTALMNAGRLLLDAWQAHGAAFEQLTTVHRGLQVDLAMNEECLAQSGALWKEKDRVLQELRDARDDHEQAEEDQATFTPALRRGNEARIRILSQGMQEVPTLEGLRRNVREKHLIFTTVILKLTGKIQYHFPEVILFVGQGLPPDLAVLWRPAQTLESFDSKELVSRDANHKVWRVWIGDTQYAIKEYGIDQPAHLQTCLKEAGVIYRHRHPNIVQLKAIFQGSGSEQGNFYLQMPWYDNGTLEQWAGGDSRPEWTQVRSVLLDALVGLVHLHAHGVIHGDVKPANILVDARERGLLADFDISIDTKSRTSAAHVTRKSTIRAIAQGMTAGFAAPELQSSGQATRHTDMFAYGKTVSQVGAQCEPGDAAAARGAEIILNQARGQAAALVGALTAPSPSDRPSAEAATQHPFFTILGAACQRISKTCDICFCLADSAAGVECSEGHFHCDSCVARHAETFLDFDNLGQRKEREGHLKCSNFPLDCNSGFADRDLAKHLHVALFKTYLEARVEAIKAQMQAQLEAEMQDRLGEELHRLAVLDEHARKVLVARKHIINKILTLTCPRCGQAFFDFDGCYALKCSACPCHFCGWCLADCGTNKDAHAHVRQCHSKPAGADVFFGTPGLNKQQQWQEFEEAQRRRQTPLIRTYLNREVEADLKAEVVAACRAELEVNKLWPIDA
jgi:serine/threonine protein kinase